MARAQYPGVYRTGSETWCYKLRLPLDAATGKRPWEVRGAFTTARAAHDARTRRQAQLLDGVQTRRDGRTVADAVADWIGGRRRARVSSRHRWETTARLYITPYLGDVRLDRLDDRTIDRWISSLERAPNSRTKQAGLSAGTIGQARALLSSALSAEVRARRMTHNPALAVETPPVERTPPRTWTDDEIARALVAIDADERFGAAWLLMLLAQLHRRGDRPGMVGRGPRRRCRSRRAYSHRGRRWPANDRRRAEVGRQPAPHRAASDMRRRAARPPAPPGCDRPPDGARVERTPAGRHIPHRRHGQP